MPYDIMQFFLNGSFLPLQLRKAVNDQAAKPIPAAPCPGSSCVCESDLQLRIKMLYDDLMNKLNEKSETSATVFISSDNSTGLSQQVLHRFSMTSAKDSRCIRSY